MLLVHYRIPSYVLEAGAGPATRRDEAEETLHNFSMHQTCQQVQVRGAKVIQYDKFKVVDFSYLVRGKGENNLRHARLMQGHDQIISV